VHQTNFGSGPGSNPDQFRDNREATVSQDGQTVWVAEYGNDRIAVWSESNDVWSNQAAFGSTGSGVNEFYGPLGVACSADKRTVWVADTFNLRVSIWTQNGGVWSNQTTIATGQGQGIAVSADEQTFWLAHYGNHLVSVWTKSGATWNLQTTFGSGPGGGASQFNQPVGVAVSADGQTVWVCDRGNHRISIWTKTGGTWSNQATFGSLGSGPDQLNVPQGLAIAADEQTVWVADYNNHRVSVWTKTNGVWGNLTTFGTGPGSGETQLDRPPGIAVSADGETAFVAEWIHSRVSVWALTCPP
jgi:DNA-binding beta-propeller fold protein YncE